MDMKINRAYGQYVSPARKAGQTYQSNQARTKDSADKVSLSRQAEDFRTAMKAIGQVPDTREALVESISARIAAGTYGIPASDVAARIFQGSEG